MGDWFGVAIVFGVAVIAFILKFVIIKCYLSRCRRGGNNHASWSDVEEGPSLEAFFIGDMNVVRGLGRNKGPPPKFEKALTCSSPVHFVDLEEPPPSYEEYMKGQAKLFTIALASGETQTIAAVQCDVDAIQSASRNLVPTRATSDAPSSTNHDTLQTKQNES